jgi:hypothetical protein
MAALQQNFGDLSITSPGGLDNARRASIKAALESYQRTVLNHNYSNLRTIVDEVEARCERQSGPPDDEQDEPSDDEMELFEEHVLCEGITEFATSPRGLLEPAVRSKLIDKCNLDGIYHLPETFRPDRNAWYAIIRGLLEEQNVTATAFPPPDLEYLCTLVDGICGPGLPQHVFMHQYNMLDVAERLGVYKDTVFVGEASLPAAWGPDDLEIELCIKIGRNYEHSWGGSYLLRCRGPSDEQPLWKYAAHADENASDVYDSLEQYLAFYSHFNEQGRDDIERVIQDLCAYIGS